MTATTLDVQRMALADVNPAEYNPRVRLEPGSAEYDGLRKSIETFGYVDPLVWNKHTGNLVGGHQRYWILLDMGATEADVSVVDLDDDREKALNIALNNPKLQGSWNIHQLRAVVDSLDIELQAAAGMYDRDVAELMRVSEIDNATTFLGDFNPDDDHVSIGAPELKDDHPHRTGEQFFQMQIVLDEHQRSLYYEAINRAKRNHGIDNSMEALVAVCERYIQDDS